MKIQNGLPIQPRVTDEQRDLQMREAASLYERHFLDQMVKSMRKTVPNEDGLIRRNMAEKIFSENLDQEYVKGWVDKGGVGLADLIYTQIKAKFGPSHPPAKGGMMPLAPKGGDPVQVKTLPAGEGARLNYRFEIPNSGDGAAEALAPFAGRVTELVDLGDRWNLVRLDHGQGLRSELTFPGSPAAIVPGESVEPGRKLGAVDMELPVLAWKLERKSV